MFRTTLSAAAALLVLACGSASDTGSGTEATSTGTVLTFAKDWSVSLSTAIDPAHALTLQYDLSRLSKCRLNEYGGPAWAVLAYVSFDGRAPDTIVLGGSNGFTSGIASATIPVPIASDVAFFFYASDDGGCTEWDSSYGQNFHFPVIAPQGPTVRFDGDFSKTAVGAIGPGTVLVDYDLARSPCRGSQFGRDAFSVTMWSSVDGAPAQSQSMTTTVDTVNFETPRFISLPQGDHQLAIWFENGDVFGCHEWDSNYGQNFTFSY